MVWCYTLVALAGYSLVVEMACSPVVEKEWDSCAPATLLSASPE